MTDSDSDAKRCFRLDISCMFQHLLTIVLIQFAVTSVHAEKIADRRIEHLVASRYGSNVVAAINDDGASQQSRVVFMSPSTGQIVWQRAQPLTIGSVAISPDGNTVAVGLVGVPDRDLGVVLLDAHTGKQVGRARSRSQFIFYAGNDVPTLWIRRVTVEVLARRSSTLWTVERHSVRVGCCREKVLVDR
jgi:hypothetical protein